MDMKSSSHSSPKEISEALCIPSKIYAFLVCGTRLNNNRMCHVCVPEMVEFFGN